MLTQLGVREQAICADVWCFFFPEAHLCASCVLLGQVPEAGVHEGREAWPQSLLLTRYIVKLLPLQPLKHL